MIDHLTLQLATHRDAAGIARMSRDRIETGLGWSWTARRVRHSIDAPATNVVIAVEARRLVGFGIMAYADDEAHLLLLAVQTSATRRGVGKALVAWLEETALAAGIDRVYLEARAGNVAARSFYRRLGYHEFQHLPAYYGGQEAAVRLAKDLWSGSQTTARG